MRNGLRLVAMVGELMRYFSLLFLLPAIVALAYDPWDLSLGPMRVPGLTIGFLATGALVAALGQSLVLVSRDASGDLQEKEAYQGIAVSWMALTFLGALPFLMVIEHPVDAWFESMSGLTATGATIIQDIDGMPHAILFWRALLQFVAGLGIVVVGVALLSRLTHGGAQLLAGDIGGTSKRLRPKIREAGRAIWGIYALMTAVLAFLYLLAMHFDAGLSWKDALFDAVVHAFSTISTGGFSSHNANLAFFDSRWVELIAIVFMLGAGTSFALLAHARKDPRTVLRDPEWRFYLTIIIAGTVVVTGLLWRAGEHAFLAFRHAMFTMASIGTSTGFATVDHDAWPTLARAVLLVAMFTGAMAGSTSGGMKVLRMMLLLKVARREIKKLLHPRAVIPIRHGGRPVKEQALLTVIAFFFTYITIWMVAAITLVAVEPGLDLFDGAAAAAAALGNTGPAMGQLGVFDDYAELQAFSKFLLGLLMWVGRIEVFSALLVLNPRSWKN